MARERWSELERKAQAGDAQAQWEVGSWFEDGLADLNGRVLVHANARTAVRWYRLSAIGGNSSAQISLGNSLSNGRGVCRDDAEALRWYKRALRQGDFCAPNNIAAVYRDQGDHRRAMFWYRRAVAIGDDDALVEVGFRYYEGTGVRRDPVEAVCCYRKAIASKNITEAGRESAMFHLGVAFHEGRGVKQSDVRALKWLRRANTDDDFPDAHDLIEKITAELVRAPPRCAGP
jgi:TPR repeat protein